VNWSASAKSWLSKVLTKPGAAQIYAEIYGRQGGKYLILPPDYKKDLDPPVGGFEAKVEGETYFVSKSASYINWFIARGFLVDGKTDTAVRAYKDDLRIYPV